MSTSRMEGTLAIVTGGATGIGLAISQQLARMFDTVVIVGRRREKLETARALIDGNAVVFAADVGDEDDIRALVDFVDSSGTTLQALVNNAGAAPVSTDRRLEGAAETFDRVVGINLRGPYMLTAGLSVSLKRPGGRIVNVTSVGPYTGSGGAAYAASKAGLHGMTVTLAKELGPDGITVNAVAPGFVTTDMTADVSEGHLREVEASIPLGRFGTPHEIASAVAFLCSDAASYVNGQILPVCGGKVLGR